MQKLNFIPFKIRARLYSQPLRIIITISTQQHLYQAQYTNLPSNIKNTFDSVVSLYAFISQSYDKKQVIRVNDQGNIFIRVKSTNKEQMQEILVLDTVKITQGYEYEGYCTRKKIKLQTQALTKQIEQIQENINKKIQHIEKQQSIINQYQNNVVSIQDQLSHQTKQLINLSIEIKDQPKEIYQEKQQPQNQNNQLIQSKQEVDKLISNINQHIKTVSQEIINNKQQVQTNLNILQNQNRKNIITGKEKAGKIKQLTKFKIWNWKNNKFLYSEDLKFNIQTLTFQKIVTIQQSWSWISSQKPLSKDKQTYFNVKIIDIKQDGGGMLVGIISQRFMNLDVILGEENYFYNPVGQLWSGKQLKKTIQLLDENVTIGVLLDPIQRKVSWFNKSQMIQSIEIPQQIIKLNLFPIVYLPSFSDKIQFI